MWPCGIPKKCVLIILLTLQNIRVIPNVLICFAFWGVGGGGGGSQLHRLS